jgi:SPX domain protein involved in polyphosphate accumulation
MITINQGERCEVKFASYQVNYPVIINWLKSNNYNFKKEYRDRIVNNLYFDTNNLDAYKDNIYGHSSRIKTRFRWFGNFNEKNFGNLELKFKRNIYGWKERCKIKKLRLENNQDLNTIKSTISKHLPFRTKIFFYKNNIPQIVNQYEREYFISSDKKYRITIDRNMKVFNQRNNDKINLKKEVMIQNHIILEVKFERSSYNKIDDLLYNIPFRASRNSKYINSIKAVMGI